MPKHCILSTGRSSVALGIGKVLNSAEAIQNLSLIFV
jgi:hypothetical protein